MIKTIEEYNESKLTLEKLKKAKDFYNADIVNFAMKKYRRENNIFESSDCVFVDGYEDVYQIQYVYESACGYGMYQGRQFSHSMIERHATPQEIEAGHRID